MVCGGEDTLRGLEGEIMQMSVWLATQHTSYSRSEQLCYKTNRSGPAGDWCLGSTVLGDWGVSLGPSYVGFGAWAPWLPETDAPRAIKLRQLDDIRQTTPKHPRATT